MSVGQPDRVLANSIVGHKAKRRPGAGEEWLAATEHDGAIPGLQYSSSGAPPRAGGKSEQPVGQNRSMMRA